LKIKKGININGNIKRASLKTIKLRLSTYHPSFKEIQTDSEAYSICMEHKINFDAIFLSYIPSNNKNYQRGSMSV